MTWFKVDDRLAIHPKAHAAGNAALGLWVRAGSWCSANLTDGALPKHMVGTLGAQVRDARKLVQVGLWMRTDEGYQFKDWDHYQPSKAQVEADRAAARERQRRHREEARHAVTTPVTNGVSHGVSHSPPSSPVPSSSGLGSQSLPAVEAPTAIDGLDLDRIKTALRSDVRRAEVVASTILAKAPRPPGNPTAYVVNAIQREPHLYRETVGPPSVGQLCPDHGRDRATCPDGWHS